MDTLKLNQGLTNQHHEALTEWLGRTLLSDQELPEAPQLIESDDYIRVVFITVADREGHHQVAVAMGQGIAAAGRLAYKRLQETLSISVRQCKVDIMLEATELDNDKIRKGKPVIPERALLGVAVGSLDKAWLPEENMCHELVSRSGKIVRKLVKRHMSERVPNLKKNKVWVFSTQARYITAERHISLFRNHALLPDFNDERMKQGAKSGAAYLARHTNSNGRMNYFYQTVRDTVRSDYNILRHAGATWSMIETYRDFPEASLREPCHRAVRYLKRHIKDFPSDFFKVNPYPDLKVVVEKNAVKLGGNGLGLVALAAAHRHLDDQEALPIMQGLARWILATQASDGSFRLHKMKLKNREPEDFYSGFYPGEAILGLMRLYQIDRNNEWLMAADRAARWLIEVRDGGKKPEELAYDHWLMYALNELHRELPRDLFLNHMEVLAETMMYGQFRNAHLPDWNGGWYNPTLAASAGCMCEGLGAGYQLLRDYGRTEKLERIKETVDLGIRHQLQCQFFDENTMYLPNPKRAHGGFHSVLHRWDVRIDYPQHCLSSFLQYLRVFS